MNPTLEIAGFDEHDHPGWMRLELSTPTTTLRTFANEDAPPQFLLGVEGTADVVPEEAAARAMELRVEGDAVHVVLRDANSLAVARGVVEAIGGPLRGSDPVGAGAVVPWNAVVRYLLDVQARVTPVSQGPLTTDPATDQRRTIVQRALRGRMGRRGGEPPPQ